MAAAAAAVRATGAGGGGVHGMASRGGRRYGGGASGGGADESGMDGGMKMAAVEGVTAGEAGGDLAEADRRDVVEVSNGLGRAGAEGGEQKV